MFGFVLPIFKFFYFLNFFVRRFSLKPVYFTILLPISQYCFCSCFFVCNCYKKKLFRILLLLFVNFFKCRNLKLSLQFTYTLKNIISHTIFRKDPFKGRLSCLHHFNRLARLHRSDACRSKFICLYQNRIEVISHYIT